MKTFYINRARRFMFEPGDQVAVVLEDGAGLISTVLDRNESLQPGTFHYMVEGCPGWLHEAWISPVEDPPLDRPYDPYILFGESQGYLALDLTSAGTGYAIFTTQREARAFARSRGWRNDDARRAYNRFSRFWVVGQQVTENTYRLLTADGWKDYCLFLHKRQP